MTGALTRVPTALGDVAVAVHGSGTPVILLHANPGDRRDFDAVVPALAERHMVYAVDWPGYGDSARPAADRISAMAYASILPRILDGLGLERACLIGNSVGGYAAARLALTDPDRVAALVLVNSGGFSFVTPFNGPLMRLIGTTPVMRLLAGRLPRRYLRVRTPSRTRMIERDAARRHDRASLATAAAIWRSFGAPAHDLRAAASAITAPTLLCWGTRDPLVGRDGRAARRAIAHAAWHPLATGHAPFAEAPEDFLRAVLPFLARRGARLPQ
ncbi:alpha/beta fold hydrolase [Streptomyces sp. NPDC020719]|uniref:alpha/beta fold hydrolase n=1 Tax=Streptomyces sp. NPDC020719 TaxID=3154896 RepID=UPI0033FE41BB